MLKCWIPAFVEMMGLFVGMAGTFVGARLAVPGLRPQPSLGQALPAGVTGSFAGVALFAV
jgi:hypothetical protein